MSRLIQPIYQIYNFLSLLLSRASQHVEDDGQRKGMNGSIDPRLTVDLGLEVLLALGTFDPGHHLLPIPTHDD
jgi:hypothetical protein